MLEYVLIAICTLFASFVSFCSGFGLGTLLVPVMTVFLPLPVAVTLTAVVHLMHNFLKTSLLWKSIHWYTATRFGVAALLAAIPGAFMLKVLSKLQVITIYSFWQIKGEISYLHIFIGVLLILLATMEMVSNRFYSVKNLFLGGLISGFLGGLSGNQGALRSAFLIHAHLGTKAFIATSAVIAVTVDVGRLVVYGLSFQYLFSSVNLLLLVLSMAGAVSGVCLGMLMLGKISIAFIKNMMIALLYLFGLLLIAGLI